MIRRRLTFRGGAWLPTASVVLVLGALVVGCGRDPTGPGMPILLSEPLVMVGGAVMNGQTVSIGHGDGASTLFQAHLTDAWGRPLTGGVVRVRYQRPGGMGMMGGRQGEFRLYDDGTHGDPVPGDGYYCFEDWEAMYGCHAAGLGPGPYHYEFWGEQGGHQSNHHEVTVTLR